MTGITKLLRVGGTAVSALMVCSPMLLAARPRTPLRVFCIAVFEYNARLRGGTLGRQRRLAIAHAWDFGSLCDEYYDEQKLDRAEYRSLRSALRRIAPEAATFALQHHPVASAQPFNLTLSGHLHGGQFVFYQRHGKLYPGAFLYRWNGLRFDDKDGRTLLISRGIQDTLPPSMELSA